MTTVSSLRSELFLEHLAVDTSDLNDAEALRLFGQIARENADRYARDQKLESLAVALDPITYGE